MYNSGYSLLGFKAGDYAQTLGEGFDTYRNLREQGYSKEEAAKVAAYLSNTDNQAIRLDERAFCPTDDELFADPSIASIDEVNVVIEQSEYSILKPALPELKPYWDAMAAFLNGVFTKNKKESGWSSELQAIETKVKNG